MLKQTITYKDYNGKERTEDFFFHLSKAEVVEMLAVSEEDLGEKMKKIVEANDGNAIMRTFKELLFKAYGEKSEDGRRFMKDEGRLAKAFSETEAYTIIFLRLVTEPDFASTFVNGIIPKDN